MGTVGIAADPSSAGYWGVGSDGGIANRGGAQFFGSFPGLGLGAITDCVGMSGTASGKGYYLVRNVAGFGAAVYAFGDGFFYGNGSLTVGAVKGIRANPNPLAGSGYWIFDSQGNVDAFGSCNYFGGVSLSVGTISALIPLPNGNGYWLVTNTGTVYNFSVPGISSFTPAFQVVSGDPSPDGQGFYMADALGNAYCTGSAKYNGGNTPVAFVTGLCRTLDGGGYFMVDFSGNVYTDGDATYAGGLTV